MSEGGGTLQKLELREGKSILDLLVLEGVMSGYTGQVYLFRI